MAKPPRRSTRTTTATATRADTSEDLAVVIPEKMRHGWFPALSGIGSTTALHPTTYPTRQQAGYICVYSA